MLGLRMASAFAHRIAGMALLVACTSTEEAAFSEPPPPAVERADGVTYPTDNLGFRPQRGALRGNRIANYAFWGYPSANTSAPLSAISLSRYYNPEQSERKLLHLFIVAGWCPICRSEATSLTSHRADLEARGVSFLTVMVNGNKQGTGPSLNDLKTWSERHPMKTDLALDIRGEQLSGFDLSGVPWNALIDTRTMEILAAVTGAPQDIKGWVNAGLTWTTENPPSY